MSSKPSPRSSSSAPPVAPPPTPSTPPPPPRIRWSGQLPRILEVSLAIVIGLVLLWLTVYWFGPAIVGRLRGVEVKSTAVLPPPAPTIKAATTPVSSTPPAAVDDKLITALSEHDYVWFVGPARFLGDPNAREAPAKVEKPAPIVVPPAPVAGSSMTPPTTQPVTVVLNLEVHPALTTQPVVVNVPAPVVHAPVTVRMPPPAPPAASPRELELEVSVNGERRLYYPPTGRPDVWVGDPNGQVRVRLVAPPENPVKK